VRAASSSSHEVASKTTAGPLNEQGTEKAQPNESDALSTDTLPMTAISPSVDASIRRDRNDRHNDVRLEDDGADDEQNYSHEDAIVTSESSPFVAYDWSFDPSTGWWTKQIVISPDRPDSGMTLRIHEHAEAILFGDPDNMPEDLLDEQSDRTSVGHAIGALAGHLSRQAMASMASINTPSARVPDAITPVVPKGSPAVISPIRAMRPARQISTASSPGIMSNPTAPSVLPAEDTLSFAEALLMESAVEASSANNDATGSMPTQEESQHSEIAQVDATTRATPAKASKTKSIRIKSPRRPARNSGRFMAATASSARKTSVRVSSREPTLRQSTSGSISPSQRRKVPSRMSKIKETLNARRADMRASHIPPPYQPPPPPKVVGAPGEVEKTATMRLRAKQSFRKLFSKVHVSDAPEVPVVATSESVFIPHDMAATVNGILASIGPMSANSFESVRSLEIAEACLHFVTSFHTYANW
jgi:hypothetical protein